MNPGNYRENLLGKPKAVSPTKKSPAKTAVANGPESDARPEIQAKPQTRLNQFMKFMDDIDEETSVQSSA